MPQPTVQQIFDGARARLGDGAVNGGERWTNARLQAHLNAAWLEMGGVVVLPRTRRDIYYNLPAYTNVFNPIQYGVTDLNEPEFVRERGSLTTVAISSTDVSTPINVTTGAAHNLATNQDCTISGVSGTRAPWGRWFVTSTGSTTLSLNGSVSDGATGSGGVITTSTDKFSNDLEAQDSLSDGSPGTQLSEYSWQGGLFRFVGSTQQRQLWIAYWSLTAAPSNPSAVIAIDNCDNFLMARVASLAAGSIGWSNRYKELTMEALGPNGVADGSGGLLREMQCAEVRSMARVTRRRRPFRSNRGSSTDTTLV